MEKPSLVNRLVVRFLTGPQAALGVRWSELLAARPSPVS
jgi:hypothetical protein